MDNIDLNLKNIPPEKLKELAENYEKLTEEDKEGIHLKAISEMFEKLTKGDKESLLSSFTESGYVNPFAPMSSERNLKTLLIWVLPILLILLFLAFKLYKNVKRRECKKKKREIPNKGGKKKQQ